MLLLQGHLSHAAQLGELVLEPLIEAIGLALQLHLFDLRIDEGRIIEHISNSLQLSLLLLRLVLECLGFLLPLPLGGVHGPFTLRHDYHRLEIERKREALAIEMAWAVY